MDRNSTLLEEIKANYSSYKGWTFDYMYPGYFSYYKADYRLFFTPDFDGDEDISIQIDNADGSMNLYAESVKYPKPLTSEFLTNVAKQYMDKVDQGQIK